jgi:signal transduction histidine kinase
MKTSRLTVLAIAVLGVSAGAGIGAAASGSVDLGFGYGFSTDAAGQSTLVIESVQPGGLAAFEGVQPGSTVTNVDGVLTTLPGDEAAQQTAEMTKPQVVLWVTPPGQPLPTTAEGAGGQVVMVSWANDRLAASYPVLLVAALVFAVGAVWRRRRRGSGVAQRGAAATILAASASPLFLLPAYLTLSPLLVLLTSFLVGVAGLVAAAAFARLITDPRVRRNALLASAALAGAAVVIGAAANVAGMERGPVSIARWVLASAVPLLPALALARQERHRALREGPSGRVGALLRAGDIAILATLSAAALAPLAALTSLPFLLPLAAWALVAITLGIALAPIASEAGREAREHELVVDRGESERARIAADIHDDVVQDLAMLVHRLDLTGAADEATTVRRAIDRLRTILADLRPSVLDDLGLASALRSYVSQVEAAAGLTITVECSDDGRLPREVELGLYRIGQEAVANAVRHGRPPIVVRLRTQPDRAELEVDDAGPGVGADPLARPASPGHMGFLAMTQRASRLGAALTVADRAGGGTRVRVMWEHRASDLDALSAGVPAG